MSTKNIARTAIEGGRANSNKNDRWETNRIARRETHVLMHLVSQDPTRLDEACFPIPRPMYKDFADKLSAPRRWLAKVGIGKTVHQIKALLLTRFDTRTLAGRHLVFDHLMPTCHSDEWSVSLRNNGNRVDFDENGVLRRNPPSHRRPWFSGPSWQRREQAAAWKDTLPKGDRVHVVDAELWWFSSTKESIICECLRKSRWGCGPYDWSPSLGVYHPLGLIDGEFVPVHRFHVHEKMRPLSPEEVDLFWSLDSSDRRKIRLGKEEIRIARF